MRSIPALFASAFIFCASSASAETRVFIAYDDEASIREKARFAVRMDLRGMMFWELAQDRHAVLGSVIAEELQRR